MLRFQPNPDGPLALWDAPNPDWRYLVACDAAYGGTAWTVADVWTRHRVNGRRYRQEAQYRTKSDLASASVAIYRLCVWYGSAILTAERQVGIAILDMVRSFGYGNIDEEFTVGNIEEVGTHKMGVHTTSQNKPVMLGHLGQFLRQDLLDIRSDHTISELRTFVHEIDRNGEATEQVGPLGGATADCVSVLWQTVRGLQRWPYHPPDPEPVLTREERRAEQWAKRLDRDFRKSMARSNWMSGSLM